MSSGSPSPPASGAVLASSSASFRRLVARGWRIGPALFGFGVAGVGSLLLALVVFPLVHLLPGDRERRELRAQGILHSWARAYFRALHVLGIFHVRCDGGERLRKPGILVVANHPTLLDAVVLMSLMPQADCVVKERYYRDPFVGGTARGAGYVSSGSGPGLVDECVERLRRGRSVIIFPEGTRSPAGGLGPFARGAAHIALRAGCEPTPVTIRCDPPVLYRGQPWWDAAERSVTLSLEVGESLAVSRQRPVSRARAARLLTSAMRDHFQRGLAIV